MASADNRDTKRFAYAASTVGVGAVLTSHGDPATGFPWAESWAPACLPIIGGRSGSVVNGPVVFPSPADYARVGLRDDGPVLQFNLAETEITGRQVGFTPQQEEYETVITKTVTNLNILSRLTASLKVQITFHYTRQPTPGANAQRDRVDVTIDTINPFVITTPGVVLSPPLPNPIRLNTNIPRSAGADFKKFLRAAPPDPDLLNTLRPPPAQHHRHEHGEGPPGGHSQGVIYTALAEPVTPQPPPPSLSVPFKYDETTLDFGKFEVPVPNLGSGSKFEVYVGEWAGEPYHQSITFLRVELTNVQDQVTPRGTFSGEIIIDDDGNGVSYP